MHATPLPSTRAEMRAVPAAAKRPRLYKPMIVRIGDIAWLTPLRIFAIVALVTGAISWLLGTPLATALNTAYGLAIVNYLVRRHQRLLQRMRGSIALGIFFMALLIAAPAALPPFAMTLLTELVILGLFAMSLDLMVGYTRLVSFGHAAAYGIGAYASGYMLLHSSTPLLFVVFLAALLTGFIAIGVGWVCTLATGVSFSMLTLAFAQLLYAIAFKWTSVTGGSDGLAGIPRRPGPMDITFLSTKAGFYYFALACLLGAYLLCRGLVASPFGAVLRGIRENEAKTTALGYNTRLYKIAVVAIAYGLGGLAGALYAPFAGFANTELLFWLLSGQVLIMVIVGGAGTLVGPVLGAAFFMLMEHQLSAWTEAWALYFGLIFIAFVLFAPHGIWGLATGRFRSVAERH